jgi:hypothetical protein
MRLKRAKKFEEWLELKPVTDEEFEELLNDPPRKEVGRKKRAKIKKREFYNEYF